MDNLYVIDLFCGCGGFSEGARQAGANVILAVDNWKEALDVHQINHPHTTHWNIDLGGDIKYFSEKVNNFIMENTPANSKIHLHMSPPCQQFSSINHKRNIFTGMKLVEWCLELKDLVKVNTWTIEQVVNPVLIQKFSNIQCKVVKFKDYGIPSTRKRLIVGNLNWEKIYLYKKESVENLSSIIKKFQFETDGFNKQTSGTFRNGLYTYKDIDSISYTVTSNFPKLFKSCENKSKTLPINILAYIQTFPLNYIFDKKLGISRKMIGNSVPPEMSRILINSII